jgi:hypothetical protein
VASARVNITKQSVYRAVNTPGGPVYEWRDRMMHDTQDRATVKAPVNNPLNARHRGGGVGTYNRGFRTRRTGNQNGVGAVIFNDVAHAIYVEEGRSESTQFQVFSWTKWNGEIHYINGAGRIPNYPLPFGGRKTAARPGKHILANALQWAYRRNV